jgi:hypothetical protein
VFIKSAIIERKSFKAAPTFLNKSRIDALIKHYKEPFAFIKHDTAYYWLKVSVADWPSLGVIIIQELAYIVSANLPTDYDELSNQLLMCLLYRRAGTHLRAGSDQSKASSGPSAVGPEASTCSRLVAEPPRATCPKPSLRQPNDVDLIHNIGLCPSFG